MYPGKRWREERTGEVSKERVVRGRAEVRGSKAMAASEGGTIRGHKLGTLRMSSLLLQYKRLNYNILYYIMVILCPLCQCSILQYIIAVLYYITPLLYYINMYYILFCSISLFDYIMLIYIMSYHCHIVSDHGCPWGPTNKNNIKQISII